jgi:hypothetical protein
MPPSASATSQVPPIVRYLILCDEVHMGQESPERVSLLGLVTALRSLGQPPFPLLHPQALRVIRELDAESAGRFDDLCGEGSLSPVSRCR